MIELINDTLITQKNVIKLFENTIKKNRLVHTYLFEGDFKTNAKECAYLVCAMIFANYENIDFDVNSSLSTQIFEKNHPNILEVEAINGVIKKEQIQALIHEFQLTPLQKGPRIYIIDGIDKCNITSSNTLLKFLEETTDNCYGILICENSKNVLETIKSRSVLVRLNKSDSNQIYSELIKNGYRKDVSYFASILSSDLESCKKLISDSKIIELTDATKKVFDDVWFSKYGFVSFSKLVLPILKEQEYDYTNMFFEMFLEMNRILLEKNSSNETDFILYQELFESITKTLSKTEIYINCVNRIDIILKFKERLKYNVNVDLQFASMFSLMGEVDE